MKKVKTMSKIFAKTYRNGRVKLPVMIVKEDELEGDPEKMDLIEVESRKEAVEEGLRREHYKYRHLDKRNAVFYDKELGMVVCPICAEKRTVLEQLKYEVKE